MTFTPPSASRSVARSWLGEYTAPITRADRIVADIDHFTPVRSSDSLRGST